MQLVVMGQREVIPVCIRKANIRTTLQPYYLHKVSKFIFWDCSSRTVNVCNLGGEILVSLEDHRIFLHTFSRGSHITKSQDIIISVCNRARDSYSINVTSIVTGQCLAGHMTSTGETGPVIKDRRSNLNHGERSRYSIKTGKYGFLC